MRAGLVVNDTNFRRRLRRALAGHTIFSGT